MYVHGQLHTTDQQLIKVLITHGTYVSMQNSLKHT